MRSLPTNDYHSVCDGLGNIKELYFGQAQHIRNLSVNLWGIFTASDNQITLTEEGKAQFDRVCDPDYETPSPQYGMHFKIDPEKGFFHIQCEKLENKVFRITLGPDNEEFRFMCKIEHDVRMWNYWHFELRWILEDIDWNEQHPKFTERWNRSLGKQIRNQLKNFGKLDKIQPKRLPTRYFRLN